ncbi:MAG: ATP-dependent DNA helicase [Candidatus Ozemobacter sibiricus]|jgi:ATP-dependent DNA helicase RecG|uniref:ATP-dependent DNA helicase n=1 Tax=Candidatus Ozemobacter sibiricus TaxID=2268124 RepID=A0A367ZJQ7_9BACT|nr:MAG: ATP-dependent DNA helicase [Candidatus Ozemobacter sibiricus]
MTKTEFFEILKNGEHSGVEFKRDDVENHELAKELVAFLNLEGGSVLLGIDDDGSVVGLSRANLEEWVAELCRVKIDPPIVPHLEWVRAIEPGKDVLVVRVPAGPNKPYARVHHNRRTYFIRVGRTSREASRDELERMFQASGRLQYGLKPVPGAALDDLDRRRLREYFVRILGGSAPDDQAIEEWERLLRNIDLMTVSAGQTVPTIDGMLLFGKAPKRFLPQSGIRAVCFSGTAPDYAMRADEQLGGPLVPLGSASEAVPLESGLVEQALDFVKRNTETIARLEGGQRIVRPAYPPEVLREAVVNALVHRDYSIAGTDILLAIYADRLEIQSPGSLPNTVTVDGMKAGLRYARNQTLVNVMRDYRYVEALGMGVRCKIIPGMRAHNGTEPELLAEEHRFTVRLWKEPKSPGV